MLENICISLLRFSLKWKSFEKIDAADDLSLSLPYWAMLLSPLCSTVVGFLHATSPLLSHACCWLFLCQLLCSLVGLGRNF